MLGIARCFGAGSSGPQTVRVRARGELMSSIDIVAPLDHLDKEPPPPGPSLRRVLETLGEGGNAPLWHSDWAWENYERAVLALAREFGLWRLLEIGGGRDPAFAAAARENRLRLIVNDIDPLELARVPEGIETACFDVAGDISRRPELYGAFDIVASRMVFEHIRNVPAAWRNIYRLLRPGGVGLAFFPTLYAWPFLLNHILPDDIARRIVERVFPARAPDGDNPVFPPVYHWCYGDVRNPHPALLGPPLSRPYAGAARAGFCAQPLLCRHRLAFLHHLRLCGGAEIAPDRR